MMDNSQEIISDFITITQKESIAILEYNQNNTRLGDGEWTKRIFERLTKKAYNKYNYWVWANPNGEDMTINEWLYDMVWYKSTDGKIIEELKMILESEWKKDFNSHQYDFQKLIQSKCKLKIFMFRVGTETDVITRIKELIKLVKEYDTSNSKETYLFAGWDDNDDSSGFSYYQYFKNDLEQLK